MMVSFDGSASSSTSDVLASGATAFVMPISSMTVDGGTTIAASAGSGTLDLTGTGTTVVASPMPTGTGTGTTGATGGPTLATGTAATVEGAERIGSAKTGLEKLVPVDSPSAQKKALPKWVVPVGIAVLVIVAAFAAYKLWFTGKASA